jgi:hypothetical protein
MRRSASFALLALFSSSQSQTLPPATSTDYSYSDDDDGAANDDPSLLMTDKQGCAGWCKLDSAMCNYDPCESCQRSDDSPCFHDANSDAEDEELVNQKAGLMAGCSAWCKKAICNHAECHEARLPPNPPPAPAATARPHSRHCAAARVRATALPRGATMVGPMGCEGGVPWGATTPDHTARNEPTTRIYHSRAAARTTIRAGINLSCSVARHACHMLRMNMLAPVVCWLSRQPPRQPPRWLSRYTPTAGSSAPSLRLRALMWLC